MFVLNPLLSLLIPHDSRDFFHHGSQHLDQTTFFQFQLGFFLVGMDCKQWSFSPLNIHASPATHYPILVGVKVPHYFLCSMCFCLYDWICINVVMSQLHSCNLYVPLQPQVTFSRAILAKSNHFYINHALSKVYVPRGLLCSLLRYLWIPLHHPSLHSLAIIMSTLHSHIVSIISRN